MAFKKPSNGIMITFRKLGNFGRFGNQLFQYAGTRLYAERNGFKHTFPQWIGNEIFENVSQHTMMENIGAKFLKTVQLNDLQAYGKTDAIKYLLGIQKNLPETHDIFELHKHPKDNINLYGYLQDEFSLDLLKKNKKLVNNWFKFKNNINASFNKLSKEYSPWVGMHIRRGDLIKRGLTVPTESYIEILNKVRNGRNLYIATDDPKLLTELKYLEPFIIKNSLPEIPAYVFDFWMLKNAQTIIGGGSTFSWWAAFLSSGDYYSPPLSHLWNNRLPEFQKWSFSGNQ